MVLDHVQKLDALPKPTASLIRYLSAQPLYSLCDEQIIDACNLIDKCCLRIQTDDFDSDLDTLCIRTTKHEEQIFQYASTDASSRVAHWVRHFTGCDSATDNALESIAAAHSDGLLVLDEIGMCDPRIIGETVYMLGNGTGKARANDRGQAGRQVQEWRLLFLSTGEKTLAQHMAEANKELKAGMEVRMLAVPADASKGLGMFDTLNGFEDAAALSDALKARVAKYYGTPLTAFLTALCEPDKRHAWSAILRRTLEGFIAQSLPASASGQAHRAAARFGLAAAAGELATAMGITGWPDGTATTAARVCLNAWMNERGGVGNFEGDAIVSRLRQVIERFGESRFTRWESAAAKIDEHGPRTIDRLGFRKTMEHGLGDALHTTNTYYVLPESWRSEIFRGMNINAVNKELLQRGVIEPGNDGKASTLVRLPGLGTQRCYVVKTIPGLAESEARAA
ncbi:hypothetical protein ALP64_204798 [Pseudomonas syringae pv. actinidiae]|nr:hypothetical protein A250_26681 [Pseudomonas syringae pv. actinidiae ICMP 9617]RMS51920.1 hypothetical protein ALP64_204798 [Pseudomonas syringae pv. actinidiae]BBI45108.1 hypothetical protein KPSA1B_103861 [Pseudomonas syringae pv. actinidiae]GBH14013.1 Uncharacterized protein KPSA1_07510 [Pseudomonas syringae pv. actinidiae]